MADSAYPIKTFSGGVDHLRLVRSPMNERAFGNSGKESIGLKLVQ